MHWYYSHKGSVSKDDNLSFTDNIRYITKKINNAVDMMSKIGICPKQIKDELMLALNKPQHPNNTRRYKSFSWKFGFAQHIQTYGANKATK